MIRKMQNIDINRVADIWLKTNLKAHYFIPEQYWTSNYELVKEMLLQAEVYMYEDNKMIQGFVGLSNEYIEGIFVSDETQSCGIGKLLLDYIKNKKVRLRLNVYQKNTRALFLPKRRVRYPMRRIRWCYWRKRIYNVVATEIESSFWGRILYGVQK